MNELIEELKKKATSKDWDGDVAYFDSDKFAKLIIDECYKSCKDQLVKKEVEKAEGYTYNDGVMDCAIGLLQHFGVK